MHPQIIRDNPGSCPICGMDLVKISDISADSTITLNPSQIQLANITTTEVGQGRLNTFKVLAGRLAADPEASQVISSKIAGRIDRLFVREAGVSISNGAPIMQVFSEQLQVLQQDYLLQLKQVAAFPSEKIYKSLAEAAKNKLRLYGLSESQISSIAKSGKANPILTVYATTSGIVREINVSEGQYVAEGGPVLSLEGFNNLWVEADVYPSEIASIKKGSAITVIVNGYHELSQHTKVDFISPELNPNSQRLTIRARIDNLRGQFQPGMQANVLLKSGKEEPAISLPLTAVIRDGDGATVWVKKDADKFVPVRVITGDEDASRVIISSGLHEGDQVVITGAYLLNSEFILKKGSKI